MGAKHGTLQTGGVVDVVHRGGHGASWWTWCIANVEWVKVGECEVMKASGEGCSRPETNLMGKIAAECKMMGLLRVQKCSKHTKGVSSCMTGQSTEEKKYQSNNVQSTKAKTYQMQTIMSKRTKECHPMQRLKCKENF